MTNPSYMFSYGIFKNAYTRCNVLERKIEVTGAVLTGWVRQDGTYAAYILPKKGSEVDGVIMHGLTDEDWDRIDAIEHSYNRLSIMVDNKMCGVYVPRPDRARIFDMHSVIERDRLCWARLEKRVAKHFNNIQKAA